MLEFEFKISNYNQEILDNKYTTIFFAMRHWRKRSLGYEYVKRTYDFSWEKKKIKEIDPAIRYQQKRFTAMNVKKI